MHAMHSNHLRVPDVSAATFPPNFGIKGGIFRQYRRGAALENSALRTLSTWRTLGAFKVAFGCEVGSHLLRIGSGAGVELCRPAGAQLDLVT